MKDLSDRELYAECKKWGSAVLEARRKFAGLLPEVQRRKLYEKNGYSSIFEFAAKLAGMSREQVSRVFSVNKKLSDTPVLQKLLIQGEVSVNKLARITSIATPENQQEIAAKVKILSQNAVAVFARETQNKDRRQGGGFNVRAHKIDEPNYDFAIINAMSPELKNRIKQLMDKGHDINQILLELLNEREEKIEREIDEADEVDEVAAKPVRNRYINVKTRRILSSKFGTKCGEEGCNKAADHIHHEKQFAKYQTHDPRFLKPLCKAHHELTHVEDSQVQKFRRLVRVGWVGIESGRRDVVMSGCRDVGTLG